MELTAQVKRYLDNSVLCWLASSSIENVPNVSPKEIFTYYKDNYVVVANIASPQTVKNVKQNENVCLSFIDILVQKGYQLKGKAKIIDKNNPEFSVLETNLLKMTEGKFPFSSITKIRVEQVKPIIAPKYILYPGTTEEQQIKSARQAYGF